METKLGALWYPKTKSDRGPVAKGSIDFSRLSEEEKGRLHEAFVHGSKVYVTQWKNKHEPGDNRPDFTLTLDKPYDPNKSPNKSEEKAFADDVPF